MRAVKYSRDGKDYCLCFTMQAMLRVGDEWPDADNVMDLLDPKAGDFLPNIEKMAVILSEEGEAARRHFGYEPGETLNAGILAFGERPVMPYEIMELRMAIIRAITLGHFREIKEGGEVDLILLEMQKKTNKN